jgi:hypothetical protein
MVLLQSAAMLVLTNVMSLSLDTIELEIEDSTKLSLLKLYWLMMDTLMLWLQEDHQIMYQDH